MWADEASSAARAAATNSRLWNPLCLGGYRVIREKVPMIVAPDWAKIEASGVSCPDRRLFRCIECSLLASRVCGSYCENQTVVVSTAHW